MDFNSSIIEILTEDSNFSSVFPLMLSLLLTQSSASFYIGVLSLFYFLLKLLEQEKEKSTQSKLFINSLDPEQEREELKKTERKRSPSPKSISWKRSEELVQTRIIRRNSRSRLGLLVTGHRKGNNGNAVELKIEFQMGEELFVSWKRYSDLNIYQQHVRLLLNEHEVSFLEPFPRKSTLNEYLTGMDRKDEFLRQRCLALEKYLQSVLYGDGFREDVRVTLASYTRDFFVPHVANEM